MRMEKRMCAFVCVRVRARVWPIHSMGAPVDVCKGTCAFVRVRGKGAPTSVCEAGKRVGEGLGDIDPGGDRLGWPLSPYLLLCLISNSIWGVY